MPKTKTRRSVAKRLKITGSGRVKFRHAGKSHLLTGKGPSRRRRLRGLATLDASHLAEVTRRQLPNG